MGMGVDHHPSRRFSRPQGGDNVPRAPQVELEFRRHLVPYGDVLSVPSPAGVGKIKDLIKIEVIVGFKKHTGLSIIVTIPEGAIVPTGERRSVHAHRPHGDDLAQLGQILLEPVKGLCEIALGSGQGFVVISNLVVQRRDRADLLRVESATHLPIIKDRPQSISILELSQYQGRSDLSIDVVTKDDRSLLEGMRIIG
jgi:hypothetical protein